MKRIVLCADDYGQAENISSAIIALLETQRISATSCLVTSPYWSLHGKRLIKFREQSELGLHLNFTEGKPLSLAYQKQYGDQFRGLSHFIQQALFRKLNKPSLIAECHAQLDAFVTEVGRLPDFIDGHQHVHHFPTVRDALLGVYQERLLGSKIYIRLAKDLTWSDFLFNQKKIAIFLLGAPTFQKLLKQAKLPHNTGFSGIYAFKNAKKYASIFPQFLKQSCDGGLIMCHPGMRLNAERDLLDDARHYEFEYLKSEAFLRNCEEQKVKIVRFSEISVERNLVSN